VAITALTRAASLSFTQNLSLNITVDLSSDGTNYQYHINYKNRHLKQTYEVGSIVKILLIYHLNTQMEVPGQAELKWSGTGKAIVQVTKLLSMYFNNVIFIGCLGISWL